MLVRIRNNLLASLTLKLGKIADNRRTSLFSASRTGGGGGGNNAGQVACDPAGVRHSSIHGLEMILMGGTAPEVWIATSNGRDMIRADAIVLVRLDGDGRVTAQLRDEARVTVTLVEGSVDASTPADFHRQLVRAVAELADSSGAQLVRPAHDERGWHWTTEPL